MPKSTKFVLFKIVEFFKLIKAIGKFGPFSSVIIFWITHWVSYTFVYPISRLFLNKSDGIKLCDNFIKTPLTPQIFYLPDNSKNKIIIKEKIDWSIFVEVYPRDVYHKKLFKKGMVVVDVGAHIGLYTLMASEKVAEYGKIIAIEPSQINFEKLTENIKINNLKNIIAEKIALSDHSGTEDLFISNLSICHSLNKNLLLEENFISEKVVVNTLDNLLSKLDIKKVDIIKIDAEGAEVQILKGAKNTIKNNPNIKLLIASYHYPEEEKKVQDLLHTMGLKTKILLPDIVTNI